MRIFWYVFILLLGLTVYAGPAPGQILIMNADDCGMGDTLRVGDRPEAV
jgi:hypothetical protein